MIFFFLFLLISFSKKGSLWQNVLFHKMAKSSHQGSPKITQIRHLSKPQRKFYYLEKTSCRHVLRTTCRRFAPRYLFVLATRSSSIEVEPIHDTWIADWTTLFALSLLRMQLYEARVSRLHLRFIYISHRISYKRHCNLGSELFSKRFHQRPPVVLSFLFFVSLDFEREVLTCETHSFFVQNHLTLKWLDP